MKIKIAHVTQSLGGVKTYIESVFKHSSADQFEFIIIAPEHSEFQAFCKQKNIGYFPIKIQRGINPFKDLTALLNIITLLKFFKPDIVHTHSAKGGFLGRLAAKISGYPVIYSPHAFSYLSFKGVKRMVFYLIEYSCKSLTDKLLSVSMSEANRAIYELGYEKQKVHTILNAVPIPEEMPVRNYSSPQNIRMIGRLTYQKNPLLFLEVAASLIKENPALKFSILGAGLADHLANEIDAFLIKNELNEKIKILKWGSNETSKDFLASTDIFVMTSVFEGLPFSLLEAMAMAIPCVVSKVDGNTDVIQNNENGFSCLTHLEFSQKILSLLASEDLRIKLGQEGYKYVKEVHEIKKNIQLLEQLYIDLYFKDELIQLKELTNKANQRTGIANSRPALQLVTDH